MSVKPHFLLSLGCRSKQASDERDLPHDVPFSPPRICPFLTMFITSSSGRVRHTLTLERKEAQPQFNAALDEAVSCFDDVVDVLDLPPFTGVGKSPSAFSWLKAFGLE